MMRALLPALTGALLVSGPLAAQIPQNLDFEIAGTNTPAAGWSGGAPGYEIARDSGQARSGHWSLRVSRVGVTGRRAAGMFQTLPADRLANKRLRLSGYIRTEAVDSGYAGLWLGVTSGRSLLAVDTMPDRGPRGTTAWTRFEVELPIADSAMTMVFGVALVGPGRAWFDAVELAVLDSAGAPAVPLAEFLGRPAPPEYASWVRKHARPIASLTSDDFGDLRFLARELKGRRVVQLGESSHGVGQFDALKVRLIKYLHEALGYDVIAFESSLFECTTAYELPEPIDARRLMRECIFGVWHAQETLPLLEYILQTRHSAHPLILTGFDDQSSSMGSFRRGAFFRGLIAPLDSAYARRVGITDSTWVARGMFRLDSARAQRAVMVAFYDTLAAFLERHAAEIASRGGVPSMRAQFASRTARDMALFVQQNASTGALSSSMMRDSAMAANLDFVLDSLFPGKKVITWGHNFHLMKGPSYQLADTLHAMGQRIAERRGGEIYTIGLFMYRGTSANNARAVSPVVDMPTGSLEHLLAQVDTVPAVFLDLAHQKREPGNAWIFRSIRATDWGRTPIRIVPRNAYDGIILVRDVTPPHYIAW